MRLLGRGGDPLLRFGAVAMAVALLCAALVAAYSLLRERPEETSRPAVKAAESEPLVRSDPGVDPWTEEKVDPILPEPEPRPEPPPEPEPPPATGAPPEEADDEPEQQPDPPPERPTERPAEPLPVGAMDWPLPTDEQVESANGPRRYDLPRGAALGLTVRSIGLYDVPVLRSNTDAALDRGVIHARGTSMPWSDTPERNVYLAGHRLGWPGTGSHLIFYRLDELGEGDEIVLKARDGGKYEYRVTAAFAVNPDDTWVMGRIRDRDMLTLQTCTPIPGFQKRLVVRAERV